MTIGIYKIENKINHKIYIGQSIHIEGRFKEHCWAAQNSSNKHYLYPICCAIRKYGIENFNFSIIEECTEEELDIKEIYWIEYYDSFFNGYNLTLGGHTFKSESNIEDIQKKKQVILSIISDLKNTSLTQKELAQKYCCSITTISNINTGKTWVSSKEKYPLRGQYHDKPKIYRCIDCNKIILRGSTRCRECEGKRRQQLPPISREELKNQIRTLSFVQIGKNFQVSDNAVRKWCKKYNLPTKKSEIKILSEEQWNKI